MALFVVRHQHAAERCPAQDPFNGAMLLNHLSRPNVRQHGMEIKGEAVVQGRRPHRLDYAGTGTVLRMPSTIDAAVTPANFA
jgi:hypothetical protein